MSKEAGKSTFKTVVETVYLGTLLLILIGAVVFVNKAVGEEMFLPTIPKLEVSPKDLVLNMENASILCWMPRSEKLIQGSVICYFSPKTSENGVWRLEDLIERYEENQDNTNEPTSDKVDI